MNLTYIQPHENHYLFNQEKQVGKPKDTFLITFHFSNTADINFDEIAKLYYSMSLLV